MTYLSLIRFDLHKLLSLIKQEFSHQADIVATGFDLLLQGKALAAEGSMMQREAILSDRYPELKAQIEQLSHLRQQINDQTLAGPQGHSLTDHQTQLQLMHKEQRTLESALVHQIQEMNLQEKLESANRYSVAQALPKATMLVEFVRYCPFKAEAVLAKGEQTWQAHRYLAFILPAQDPDGVTLLDLGEAKAIERLIAQFRATITGEEESRGAAGRRKQKDHQANAKSQHLSLGTQLRQAIFDPLLPALAGCKRLFLSPDGDLTRLPFEILPSAEGKNLIDTYTFSYLSVGRDVLRFAAERVGQPGPALVLADPDFDLTVDISKTAANSDLLATPPSSQPSRDLDRAGLHFSPLPGTRREGEAIGQLLGVSPRFGAEAFESQLKLPSSPRILHLATHGFFLEDQETDRDIASVEAFDFKQGQAGRNKRQLDDLEDPLLRSGLALAGANTWLKGEALPTEAENAILAAADVAGLDFLDTDLVVLSACETGLGEVKAGEGVFGLRRAFMLAGANTLVMSLWKVPDQETQELMSEFYTRILKGEARVEALRHAQLSLKKKHDDPLFWGAFICQGEPGPLSVK